MPTYECHECTDPKPFVFDIDFTPEERATRDCPGSGAYAEIVNVDGDTCPQCGEPVPDEDTLICAVNEEYAAGAEDAVERQAEWRCE